MRDAVIFPHLQLSLEEVLLACTCSVPPNHRKGVGAGLGLCVLSLAHCSVWLFLVGLNRRAEVAAQIRVEVTVPLVVLSQLWGRNWFGILLFGWRRAMRKSDFWHNLVSCGGTKTV